MGILMHIMSHVGFVKVDDDFWVGPYVIEEFSDAFFVCSVGAACSLAMVFHAKSIFASNAHA